MLQDAGCKMQDASGNPWHLPPVTCDLSSPYGPSASLQYLKGIFDLHPVTCYLPPGTCYLSPGTCIL
ncbi:MAG: hypothetical protein D6730_04995 [Bacteroidetes bacterium]|nr:MAG: hypothetical protein D6730_04995 [Bacteroidota bacterium]